MDGRTMMDKIKLRMHYGPASADLRSEIAMRETIVDESGGHVRCYIPRVIADAQHIINMPLLTNHIYLVNSGALKNHFGTVRFSNYNAYPAVLHGPALNRSITDINANHHVRNKSRIIIADGIFGVFDRGEGAGKQPWMTLDNDFPESIFLSKDPVAIDAVMAGIVAREREKRGLTVLSHEYLKDAADQGLGTSEFRKDPKALSRIRYEELSV